MALTAEQQAVRRNGLGSSDIAAVVGLSPYRSAFDVFLDKTGRKEPFVGNEHTERGDFLEPALRRWYAKRQGCKVAEVGTLLAPGHPVCLATPDGIATFKGGEARALELKAPGPHTYCQWGKPGTDEVPLHYLPQGAWHLLATGLQRCDFAALIEGELRLYHFMRDAELEAHLVEAAEKFWKDHIEGNKPPLVTGLDDAYIRQRFPRENGEVIRAESLTEAARSVVEKYLQKWQVGKEQDKELADLRAQIQATMGEAARLEGPGWRIDWMKVRDSQATDWEAAFSELIATMGDLAKRRAQPILEKYTRVREGTRRFTPRVMGREVFR